MGESVVYYSNGLLALKRYYKNGKQDGKLTVWNENSQITEEENWKDGKMVSVSVGTVN